LYFESACGALRYARVALRRTKWIILLPAFAITFAAHASSLDDELHAAQQLAWQKHFAEAESAYRRILQRAPTSTAAARGLGEVLLWEGRNRDAAEIYRRLLRETPGDVDARSGLATAEYWSGDYRAAQRDFEAVIRARPDDAAARKALAEIAATMSPVIASENTFVTDDQPLRRASYGVATTIFSDPLTKWTATAGAYSLNARDLGFGSATAPFASIAANTSLPSMNLRASGALRVIRFPDGTTKALGSIGLAHEWSSSSLAIEIDQHELLYAASSLRTHPSETTATLAWNRNTDASSSSAAIHTIRYFDRNRGRAAEAFHLVRVVRKERVSISTGASISYRDTTDSRFRLIGASASPRTSGAFAYSYDARYDPYWTPRDLVELRGIVAATIDAGRAKVRLHADGGWAHDRDLIFGPSSGTTSLAPLFAAPIEVGRTFHPWRASAGVVVPLRASYSITFGVERQNTVFYRATAFHLGFSGRL
jgi:tetratricopeptide (TPR) repeat protein